MTIRPKDLALFLLASGDMLPRQRARDQRADVSGGELKVRLLNELVARDPEPEAIEAALEEIVFELGPPTGPTRGVALSIMDDWRSAEESPAFVEWLLDQAVREGQEPGGKRRRGRKDRQAAGA